MFQFNARIKLLCPGLLAAVTVAIAAQFLSDHYGGPAMLFALLLGMGFHFLSEEGPCVAGIKLASSLVLKFGVALLGLGISIEQIREAGLLTVCIVGASVFITLASGPILARSMGRGWRFGFLTGGAVAICGASAALAISSVLPKNKNSERNTLFTVISVTTLSTFAMIVYPIFADILELDDVSSGIFIGATIHDVAQVIGAGYSISEETGDTAAFVKLLRVTMLVPIVLLTLLVFRKDISRDKDRQLPFPLFVVGFIILVCLGSSDWFPNEVKVTLLDVSRWCLVTAIAAIGMKTALKSLRGVGGHAIALVCVETIILATAVITILLISET